MKLHNGFSLNMIQPPCRISVQPITLEEARNYLAKDGLESLVGHQDTAEIYSRMLDMNVVVNRINTTLVPGETMIVGQYKGPRLSEGATQLPEGAEIQWLLLTID